MIKNLLAGGALCLLSTSVFAADLPRRSAPAAAPLPVFSWAGAYVGGSLGFVRGAGKTSDLDNYDYSLTYQTSANAALASVNAGYNFQIGNLVYGVEADIGLTNAAGKIEYYGPSWPSCAYCSKNEISSLGSVRARLGYSFDRALVYVTGGLAFGKVNNFWAFNHEAANDDTASESKWRAGWALGAGVEYAIDRNWTVRAEGTYYDLGSKTMVTADGGFKIGYAFKSSNTASVARVGLNYKF